MPRAQGPEACSGNPRATARTGPASRHRIGAVPEGYDRTETDRITDYFALHCLTARLSHQAEILPWDLDDEDTTAGIESLWPSIYEQYPDNSSAPDMATQALDYIRHKAVFNERFLEGAKGYHELNPLGSWRRNRDLALPRPVMCQWLMEAGFNPDTRRRQGGDTGRLLSSIQRAKDHGPGCGGGAGHQRATVETEGRASA